MKLYRRSQVILVAALVATSLPVVAQDSGQLAILESMLRQEVPDTTSTAPDRRGDGLNMDTGGVFTAPELKDEDGNPLNPSIHGLNQPYRIMGPMRGIEENMNGPIANALPGWLNTSSLITNTTLMLTEPAIGAAMNAAVSQGGVALHGSQLAYLQFGRQTSGMNNGGVLFNQYNACISGNMAAGMLQQEAISACSGDNLRAATGSVATDPVAPTGIYSFEHDQAWLDGTRNLTWAEKVERKNVLRLTELLFPIREGTSMTAMENITRLRAGVRELLGDYNFILEAPDEPGMPARMSIDKDVDTSEYKGLSRYIEERTRYVYNTLFKVMNLRCVHLAVANPLGGDAIDEFSESEFRAGDSREAIRRREEDESFWYSRNWLPDIYLQDLMIKGGYTLKPAFGETLYKMVSSKEGPGRDNCRRFNPAADASEGEEAFAYSYDTFKLPELSHLAAAEQNPFKRVAEYIAQGQAYSIMAAFQKYLLSTSIGGRTETTSKAIELGLELIQSAIGAGNVDTLQHANLQGFAA